MDRRDDSERIELATDRQQLTQELVDAFVKLAAGDFSVRLPRSYNRDPEDTLAYFVNVIVEEFGRAMAAAEDSRAHLIHGVEELNAHFLEVAAGNFDVRASRNQTGDPFDVLSFLFNTTVEELAAAFHNERGQQSMLRAIFDAISDGIILADADGFIQHANGAAASLLNRAVDSGMAFSELAAPQEQAFMVTLQADVKAFHGRDTLFVDGNGASLMLVLSGQPMITDGERRGMVLSLRDERDLRQARAQLQVSDRMATMGTLAAGVAHEINNPMSFVISNLEYALEELDALEPNAPLPTELRKELIKALKTSKEGSERVTQIVRDLKSISRVDEESVSLVDVRTILDTAASMLRNEIRHRARLVKAYGKSPSVLVNEARLIQVSLNLMQNAAQAIAPGNASDNTIRLETDMSEKGELVIRVSDTGCGVAADELDAIFDSFYTTKEVGVGTGLGLSICKRLIVGMGGRIEVKSTLGRGSTFSVYIPGAQAGAALEPSGNDPEHRR